MLCLSVSGSFLLSSFLRFGLSLLSLSSTSMAIVSHSSFDVDNARRVLGWSALSGVAVVLVSYVINYPLAKYNVYVRDILCIDRSIGLF
jgi:hypothetical protein